MNFNANAWNHSNRYASLEQAFFKAFHFP